MKKQLDHVRYFHEVYAIPQADKPTVDIPASQFELRYSLMKEENDEYIEAARRGDLVEVADALGDLLYILCGTIHTHGLHHLIEEVFDEIQRSNMSKLGEDGKPIYREDGKVLKGPNYFRPDIASILNKDQ